MIKKEYKGYNIFSKEGYEGVSKKIIDKEFKTLKILKKTPRNYVAVIEIEGEKYVLKSPKNEQKRKWMNFLTKFKLGEAYETFKNVNQIIDEGLDELYIIFAAIVKRENGKIKESYIITEYIDGEYFKNYLSITDEDKKLIIESLKKLHSYGVYHGDANHTNFIEQNRKIRIIDTKCQKKYTSFKKFYDVVTLDDCIKNVYREYGVNFFNPIFILALLLKKYKKMRSKIKSLIK